MIDIISKVERKLKASKINCGFQRLVGIIGTGQNQRKVERKKERVRYHKAGAVMQEHPKQTVEQYNVEAAERGAEDAYRIRALRCSSRLPTPGPLPVDPLSVKTGGLAPIPPIRMASPTRMSRLFPQSHVPLLPAGTLRCAVIGYLRIL